MPAARPPADRPLDPVLDFLRLLWEIEHVLESTSKRMAVRLGITGPQRLVLRIVERFPGISPGELAQVVRLHPSTITGILARLERKQLLARAVDRRDRRRSCLHVRPVGRRFTGATAGTIETAVTRALARQPRRAVRQARALLATLADELKEAGNGRADALRTRRRPSHLTRSAHE